MSSSPTRTRTWNKPVNSRNVTEPNPISDKTFGASDAALAARLQSAAETTSDSDLVHVIDAWPDLPPHIRAAVLALVGAAPHP